MTTRTAEEAELPDPAPLSQRPRKSAPAEDREMEPSENDDMDTSQTLEVGPALDALTYVTFPAMNPLEVHGWDQTSTFDNLSPTQRTLWDSVPSPKILAYKAYGGRISDVEEVAQLREAIKKSLELPVHPLVAPPTPAVGRQRRDTPPYCALIGDLTEGQAKNLIARQFIATENDVFIFIEYNPQPSSFVTTLKGFFFFETSPSQTKVDVDEIIAATLFEGGNTSRTVMRVKRFLAAYRDNIPEPFGDIDNTVRFLRKSIMVEHLELVRKADVGTGGGKGHPAWNVYIHPPTADPDRLHEWKKLIRSTDFVTLDKGTGTTHKIFHCTVCRSENHPGGMCRLPNRLGWVKPPSQQSETLNKVLAANTPDPNEAGPSRGARGGRNGGRGRSGTPGRGRAAPSA